MGKADNPPASALAFLAALNKQENNNLDSKSSVSSSNSAYNNSPPSSPKIYNKGPPTQQQSSSSASRRLRSNSYVKSQKELSKAKTKDVNTTTPSRTLRDSTTRQRSMKKDVEED